MRADEARRLTDEVLVTQDGLTSPYYNHIITKIEAAIARGKYNINHPFAGLGTLGDGAPYLVYPSSEVETAVLERLRTDGFKVTHHPAPAGTQDPREHAYDEVSWK